MKRRLGAAALCGMALCLAGNALADTFKVELNQTRVLNFASPVASIMIGNPAIADVHVEGSKTVYVLGRAFGQTNLIALDDKGQQIASMDVNVVSQGTDSLTLNRGTDQYSYNCTPRCERVVNMSDETKSFGELMAQMQALSNLAGGGGGGRN